MRQSLFHISHGQLCFVYVINEGKHLPWDTIGMDVVQRMRGNLCNEVTRIPSLE